MVKIFDQLQNRPVYNGRMMDDTIITEKSGYRSAKQQVLELTNGGIRLDAYRRAVYDYEGDLPEDIRPDPSRALNLDLVDGDQLYEFYTDVLARKKASIDAKAAKAAKELTDVKIDPVKAD